MSAGRRALLAAAIGLWLAPPVGAQSIDLGSGGGRGQLIEIVAKDGIEWQRETRRYIARGEARATQGDTSIFADMLIAYYREKPEGGTEIFRYEAKGNTRIATPTQTAIGDDGVYDIDAAVIVLTGRNLKLTTPNETITARDSLEYWEARRMAVARGEAMVVTDDRRMRGDILTAHFVDAAAPAASTPARPARQGAQTASPRVPRSAPAAASDPTGSRNRLERIEGFGHVLVSTPTDVARGDRGVYTADTGIAILAGGVRITRGDNQLNGDLAEVNLNTGVSRLLSRPERGGDSRVRGLLVPQDRNPATPARPAR